jgi:DNA-binding GntR family transcriptional regulator
MGLRHRELLNEVPMITSEDAQSEVAGADDEAAPREPLRTLPEQIADYIGGDIVRGTFQSGTRLRETELATRYGVSRAPVREAIRLLARRGMVDFTPRRGAFVVEMTVDKFLDWHERRGCLPRRMMPKR